jgi:hypothetical protein
VSAEKDELIRLVRQLPDEDVSSLIDDVRRRLRPVRDRQWPPAWFASAEGDGTAVGARSEELLSDGFGQSS